MGDESEALGEIGDIFEAEEDFREMEKEEKIFQNIKNESIYKDAERAEIGTTIRCPTCKRLILKKNKQRIFCDSLCEKSFGVNKEVYSFKTNIEKAKERYKRNKDSPVGSTIECSWCGKRMIKLSYQHQFCKGKGKGNCKDSFWNNVSEKRRKRAKFFANKER